MNTKPFHKLCNSIEGNKFLDLANIKPNTTPRNTNGNILCTLKCAKANAIELTRIAHQTGMYLVRDGNKNPLNTISSQTGAQIDTTTAYSAIATGSLAIIDCSTLESETGLEVGGSGKRFRFNWESRLTKGNMKQPMITSSCQFPLRVKRNQSLASGRNMERQRWRIAIPARPSVTSVIRLNKAWPLNVRDSLWKPDI
jgi:hypothetical protein